MSDDKEKIIMYGIIGVIVIAIMAWSGTLETNTKNIQNAVTEFCGIDDKLVSAVDSLESINPELFDEQTMKIYQQLLSGNNVSKCDMWYFYQQLDDESKKKLRWNEFVCNVNDCLNQ